MTHRLDFVADPVEFLEHARGLLAGDPLTGSVVAVVTERIVREDDAGVPRGQLAGGAPYWWLLVRDRRDRVVGAAMRTAPFPPHPAYLLDMPEDAARALAAALHARGEPLAGVNGVLPAVGHCADEYARLSGGKARVLEHLRLFELGELVTPPRPPGRLRPAAATDVATCLAWFTAFGAEAAAQAGRSEPHAGPTHDEESILRRIGAGDVWLWVDEQGDPVHLTASSAPSFGVSRVGPVYTPGQHRGHGYASAAVAEVSRIRRDSGARVCLFADRDNPTSTGIYTALGYRLAGEHANLVLE